MKLLLILFVFASLSIVHSLFNKERAWDGTKYVSLSSKFSITLTKVASVPSSLSASTICQVPGFQLQQFANQSGISITRAGKRSAMFERRSTTDYSDSCDPKVSCCGFCYCDNGGAAGLCSACPGKKHAVADEDCINKLRNDMIQMAEQFYRQVLSDARAQAVDIADGSSELLRRQLVQQLQANSRILNATISTVEATLMAGLESSNVANHKALQETADSVSNQFTTAFSEIQNSVNSQFSLAQRQINSLASVQSSNTNALYSALSSASILSAQRVQNLSDYVDVTVSTINKNNFAIYLNLVETLKTVQTLMASVEKASRFELQGVDISPLLSEWENVDKNEVFQNPPLQNYTYYSSGLFGLYPSDYIITSPYPVVNELEGLPLYRCFQRGQKPTAPPDSTQATTTVLKVTGCNLADSRVTTMLTAGLQGILGTLKSACSANSQASSFLNNAESLLWGKIEGRITCSSSDQVTVTEYWLGFAPIGDPGLRAVNSNGVSCGTSLGTSPVALNSSLTSYNSDGSNSFFVVGRGANFLTELSPSGTIFNFFNSNARMAMNSFDYRTASVSTGVIFQPSGNVIQTTYSVEYSFTSSSVPSTIYGKEALFNHPDLGVVNVHRCVPVASTAAGQTLNILDHYNRRLGGVDFYGKWVANGIQIGSTYAVANGLSKSYVEMPTTFNISTPMDAVAYYYTPDIWCCDYLGRPDMTVQNSQECATVGKVVCPSANFAFCNGGLTRLNALDRCPDNSVPSNPFREVRYKSPRVYFCGSARKFREPYGVDLVPCHKDQIGLPGAGVEVQTGTISPQGIYPAACIYYSQVRGSVPLYTINARFEGQVVPTMLANLDGRKILYLQQDGKVIDEMDRLYGVGNAGYDCLTYEMDKFLHQPRACTSYQLPEYDMVSYFSGRVRAGISKYLDYFDIIPRPGSDNNTLVLEFLLKDGIDYESAYINNMNLCPRLSVSYSRNGASQFCVLQGWSNLDTNLTIAGSKVCTTSGVCDTVKSVSDGSTVDVVVTSGSETIICNRFQCKASINSFVAYPVDTFSARLERPELPIFLGSQAGYNYAAELQNVLDQVTRTVSYNLGSLNLTGIPPSAINSTIKVIVNTPDLTALLESIKRNFSSIQGLLGDTFRFLEDQTNERIDDMKKDLLDSIELRYLNSTEYLRKLADSYKVPVAEGRMREASEVQSISAVARTIAIVAVVMSAIALVIVAAIVIKSIRTRQLLAQKSKIGKKVKTAKEVEASTDNL